MSYVPQPPAFIRDTEELRRWVADEFQAIMRHFAETRELELRPSHREPPKPREGMIVSADGSDWNPGAGAGAYEFVGGVWVKL